LEIGKKITLQEAKLKDGQLDMVTTNHIMDDLIEQIAIEARASEFVDAKSGVSARMTISAYENLVSAAERRALLNGEDKTYVRVADLVGVIPAVCGKVELVYEGEVEGPVIVAQNLIGKAIRTQFLNYFPDPEKIKKASKDKAGKNPYKPIIDWFMDGNMMDILNDSADNDYSARLRTIDGLDDLIEKVYPQMQGREKLFMMEFVLHGLSEFSIIAKKSLEKGLQFKDLTDSLFDLDNFKFDEDEDDFR
jgi:magnesium chelatase subunit I